MSQNMRQLVRIVCGLLLVAVIGLVAWMAYEISGGNIDALRDWNVSYDYIALSCIVLVCVVFAVMTNASAGVMRLTLLLMGVLVLLSGVVGHYGFKYLRDETLVTQKLPKMRLRPNAAETVLGFHYICPSSGGYVAFGDGSVRYVDREQFAKLRHADTPDQPPEFTSPIKPLPAEDQSENADEKKDGSKLGLAIENARIAQERIAHSNNLKWMAEDHFNFSPQGNIRRPLKPEQFRSYLGMSDELRKAIADGTYVWYFGWDPIDPSYYAETKAYGYAETKAVWYYFASWASVYCACFGVGALFAGLTLVIKHRSTKLVRAEEHT